MEIIRTELEWSYKPDKFLEATVQRNVPDFALTLDRGLAKAVLNQALDPVPDDLIRRLQDQVRAVLDARQLLIHQDYQLDERPRIVQYQSDGLRKHVLLAGSAVFTIRAGSPDIVIKDASGNVVRDTKAERLAEHGRFIDLVSQAADRDKLLRSLLASYRAAVEDPSDEMVHLYEVRDALKKHYGSEAKARQALNITKAQWQQLGEIANDRPLEQSRHRGSHVSGRRPATAAELDVARGAARRLIEAFARTV